MQDVDTDSITLKYIAANLARYRAERGLSFSELARRCSVKTAKEKNIAYPTTIKRIEDGENMPSASLLKRLAEALEVEVRDLLECPERISA
jgi:transcriptional regulator with XRE-family HTH domain